MNCRSDVDFYFGCIRLTHLLTLSTRWWAQTLGVSIEKGWSKTDLLNAFEFQFYVLAYQNKY